MLVKNIIVLPSDCTKTGYISKTNWFTTRITGSDWLHKDRQTVEIKTFLPLQHVNVCSLHLFPSPLAGGASLGPRDLTRLYKFLKLAAPSWRKIGGELDFTFEELDAIPLMSGLYSVDDYFQKLLHLWLKRTPDRTTKEILLRN